MKKLILFLSILFLSDFVSAANLKIKLYNIDDGLNANFINDLTVDNYENIWLATNMGLKKFDGYNFVNYEIPNYNRREIKKVFFQDQLLYILYKGGILLQLNLKNGVFKKFTNDYILDFFITPQETYLLKGNFNIEIIKKRKKINYVLKFSKKLPVQDSENYYGIVSYKNSIYFSIPKMGLFRLKKNKLINLSTYYDDTPGGVRERFKIINHNLFFIGLPRPLLIENNAKPVNFIDRHNLRITDFTIKNNIKYYIRENNTLIYEQNKKSTIIIKQLKNIELRKLYFIGENIFIVSNKGLFKINFKSNFFRNFNLKNILIVKRKILEDNNRILFFGNPYIVSKKNDEITQLTKKVESFYDAVKVKNKFYLATEGKGIVVTDNNFKKLIPLDKNKLETILCVYYDENSNLIYYGNNEFLFYFRPETNSIHKIPNIFKGYNIKTIVSDYAHSRLFVGTENGVFTVNIRNKKTSKFITNKIIGDILIDKKRNLLYIGYDNGILIYNLSNLHLLKSLTLNFLKNPRVTCLLQDNQNRIWGSTYSGLIAYDYNTNNLIELENTDLLNQEYNYKSACKLKNGDLIFGGLDGYDVITPSRFDFSTPEVSGRVSGYYLIKPDDSTYYNKNNPTSIKFKNKNGFLRIYITSNNIENKETSHYQYKLDNTNWIDLKQEYKDLVGLSPGNYVLQIRGLDEVGKMIKFNPVNVIVTEEFYKSNPFIFTLIFISFLLLILIFRVLYNKVKMKNEIYEKISMDLHDEVGTILSKTSLLIAHKELLDSELKRKIQENIKQANFGLRNNINSIKKDDIQLIYTYYECIEVMVTFLSVKNIPYRYSFEGKENKKISKNLYKDLKICFFEIFNNTIKYSSTDDVNVRFSEKNNELNIIIQEKNNYIEFNKIDYGNGLMNIRKRIKRNNGTVDFQSSEENNMYSITINIKL